MSFEIDTSIFSLEVQEKIWIGFQGSSGVLGGKIKFEELGKLLDFFEDNDWIREVKK